MLLHHLIRQFDPQASLAGIPDVKISGVYEDSRRVTAGSLFVARTGTKTDGSQFLEDARNRGAAAAIVQTKSDASALPQIVAADTGAAASILANLFRGNPAPRSNPSRSPELMERRRPLTSFAICLPRRISDAG